MTECKSFPKLKTVMEYLRDKGGVGREGQLLGRLLQQLKLSQLHVLQLPFTLPVLQLLLERQLEGILRNLTPTGRRHSIWPHCWSTLCLRGHGVLRLLLRPCHDAPVFSHRVRLQAAARVQRSRRRQRRLPALLLLPLPPLLWFGWFGLKQLRPFSVLSLMTPQNFGLRCLAFNANGWRRWDETFESVLLVQLGSFTLDGESLRAMWEVSLEGCRLRVAAGDHPGLWLELWVLLIFSLLQGGFTCVGKSCKTLASL